MTSTSTFWLALPLRTAARSGRLSTSSVSVFSVGLSRSAWWCAASGPLHPRRCSAPGFLAAISERTGVPVESLRRDAIPA